MLRVLLKFLLIGLCVSTAMGGDIVFVVSKDVDIDRLSEREVRKIFLKKRKFLGRFKAVPVNLPPDNELRKTVERAILGMDREELELYWNKSYLHGIEPPIVLSSEKAVKEFVKKVKGAVGYIDSENLDGDLKVIYKLKRK